MDAFLATLTACGLAVVAAVLTYAFHQRAEAQQSRQQALRNEFRRQLSQVVPDIPVPAHSPDLLTIPSADGVSFYSVDLREQTCTCADQQDRRMYRIGSLMRICKHMAAALKEQSQGLFNAVYGNIEFGLQPTDEIATFSFQNDEIFLYRKKNADWVTVIAKPMAGGRNLNFRTFGYNIPENSWRNEEAPGHSQAIAKYIREWSDLADKLRMQLQT